MESRRRKPSLVFGLGVAALVVAASGTALAVPSVHSAINGSRIANHSITGKKLVNDTLTGKQIKESTLTGVASANNAKRLGGIAPSGFARSRSFFHLAPITMKKGAATKTLGHFGPLTFTASCAADGPKTAAVIHVKTSKTINITLFSAPMTVLTPTSPPYAVSTADQTDLKYANIDFPVVLVPGDRTFSLSGNGGLVTEANAGSSDCAFWGDLQNSSH